MDKQCCVCFCKRRRGWKCPCCNNREVHFYCIADWVKGGKRSCPLCRAEIPSDEIARILLKVARKQEDPAFVPNYI